MREAAKAMLTGKLKFIPLNVTFEKKKKSRINPKQAKRRK